MGFRRRLGFGGVSGELLPVLPGLAPAPVCWRIERERGKQPPGGPPQPGHSRGSHQRTAQKEGEARRRKLPPVSRQRGKKQESPPPTSSTPAPDTRTTAAMAAKGDGGQHGESTGTGGGPRQRQRTDSGQAPDRQQRQRTEEQAGPGRGPANAEARRGRAPDLRQQKQRVSADSLEPFFKQRITQWRRTAEVRRPVCR